MWEYFAQHNIRIELGSDQTSLHNPWAGGYYPAGYMLEESQDLMAQNPDAFRTAVQQSLIRQVTCQ